MGSCSKSLSEYRTCVLYYIIIYNIIIYNHLRAHKAARIIWSEYTKLEFGNNQDLNYINL